MGKDAKHGEGRKDNHRCELCVSERSEERENCERHAGRGRENRVRESEEREHRVGERQRSATTQWGGERSARPRPKTEREGSARIE